ncbi:hypothetical protein ES703_14035 [subsurface metagenome]
MNNTPTNKYSEIVEQCKQIAEQIRQALTVIILNADIMKTHETLSPEGEKCLEQITSQAWRINTELKKGEIQNERKVSKTFQSSIESNPGEKFSRGFEND